MNTVIRSIVPMAILGVCLLAMPVESMAGKPDKPGKNGNGGTPNHNSVAETAGCLVNDVTARVCSTKGISNVVLWCDGTWVKHEDFGPGDVYEATVGCVNDRGDRVGGGGRISMIAVKSGSQKHVKHHPDSYNPDMPVDAPPPPSGSGLFTITEPLYCASSYSCASDDNSPPPSVAGGDDSGDGNPPVVANDDGGNPPGVAGGDDGSDGGTPPGDDGADNPPGDGSDGGTPPDGGSDGGTPPGDPIEIPPDQPVLY